ncbi:pRL2-19 [Kitasatospora sp. NPDC092039]|uniref:pRL2-19 n=1 Tax=Kitasatospora sp. NPDC092039 TaxID=3364086 RepID=UPI0038291C87
MADLPTPEDMSHAMLIAVLMDAGGSVTLRPGALDPDAITGRDGSYHAVSFEPQADGSFRLSVQPRPDTPGAGLEFRPAD